MHVQRRVVVDPLVCIECEHHVGVSTERWVGLISVVREIQSH